MASAPPVTHVSLWCGSHCSGALPPSAPRLTLRAQLLLTRPPPWDSTPASTTHAWLGCHLELPFQHGVFHPTCPSSLPRACPSGAGHGATHRITGHSRRGVCSSNTFLSSEPSLHPPPRPRVLAEGCSNWPLSPDLQTLLHRGRGPAPQESECWARQCGVVCHRGHPLRGSRVGHGLASEGCPEQ